MSYHRSLSDTDASSSPAKAELKRMSYAMFWCLLIGERGVFNFFMAENLLPLKSYCRLRYYCATLCKSPSRDLLGKT